MLTSSPVGGAVEHPRILLVLVDLRGFNRYTLASRTAATHGRGIFADLLRELRGAVEAPLHVSRMERDGLCLVADLGPAGAAEGMHRRLLALLERFTVRQRHLMSANSCSCEACQAVLKIRLKILAHCGPALLRRKGRKVEATGAEVNLAHRLRDDDLHAESHLLLTEAAWGALGPDEAFDRVELGNPHLEALTGYLRTLAPTAEPLPRAGAWDRLRLALKKATWDFRFQDARRDP